MQFCQIISTMMMWHHENDDMVTISLSKNDDVSSKIDKHQQYMMLTLKKVTLSLQ